MKKPKKLCRTIKNFYFSSISARFHPTLFINEWIIVRGPRLTNESKKGQYREGWVGVNASTKISRADLTDFIIKQVEDEQYYFQMPFISY